ncbi:MAG: hypothetical protein KF819_31830 [Labilithrix sp.]|nr:hypothetical protein [Labilithrix sp.]
MSDQDPPEEPSAAREHGSEPPASPNEREGTARERFRSRLESVIPEVLKRVVEIGVEKARESPDNLKQFAQDMKLPKEIAHYLLQQIDETKNGLFRVVAKEMRDFLEHTNFSGELTKILTTVQFEVNTTIRFTPNDGPRKDGKDGKDDGEGEPASRDEREEAEADGEGEARSALPKPEVKTAVHVRRDFLGRNEKRRRSRA